MSTLENILKEEFWEQQIIEAFKKVLREEGIEPTRAPQPQPTKPPEAESIVAQLTKQMTESYINTIKELIGTIPAPPTTVTISAPRVTTERVTVKAPKTLPAELWYQAVAVSLMLGDIILSAPGDIAAQPDTYQTYTNIAAVLARLVPLYRDMMRYLVDVQAGEAVGVGEAK